MNTLQQVLTITEVARHWGKHPMTVLRAMDAKINPLEVRKAPRVWLISADSCIRRWGDPKIPLDQLIA